MNKALFVRYMENEPTNTNEKYIFIVDNQEISQAIVFLGFKSVFLAREDSEYQYSLNTFIAYLNKINYKGKFRTSYTYVPACSTKKVNDTLEEYFKAEYLKNYAGWQLFRNQEFLANYDRADELKKILEGFIKRFEGNNDLQPDLMKFHFYNDSGKITGINHNAIVEDIKEKHSLFVSGCFYESDRGHYKPDITGAKIKDYIKQRIDPDMRKSQVINQVYNLLHDDFSIERNFRDTNLYPVRWVPFNDCLLDPLTWEEIEYKDEFYCVNRLPHNWKDCKNAVDGEETEKYLRFAVPEKQDREMALEYDGLSCNRDTSFQKAMLYVGQGGSGKSIKLRMSQAVLGVENYSNVGLFDLGKRFMPGLLLGKLANICSDLPIKALSDEANEALKLIVGEDMIFHETKGQNGFFFTPYCKMTFSTNMLPQVLDERNNAVFRRLLILRMDNTPEHPDVNLFSKLEKELPYYIKLIMEALHRLYKRGYILESENSKKEIEQMRRDSDTTEDFLDMCCTKKAGARIDRGELFIRYEKHCEDEGRQALSKNAFNKAIRAKGFKQVKSCGYWYFEGISLEKTSLDSPLTDKQCSLNGVEVEANGFIKIDKEALKDLPFT